MGSNLHCSATDCAFNKTGSCYASQIKVEGFDAKITPETYCDTYREGNSFNMSNYHGETELASTQNISCTAKNCRYNTNGSCNASHVDINFENSRCETFVSR